MSSQNPQTYYEDSANHGEYAYETLENMVNNFMQNYTGNSTFLGQIERHRVLFWMKKGIQNFTADALREAKAVELELGDALDIIVPPDYVKYVRISWLNEETGVLMPMQPERNITNATAYLQDHKANILFDSNGYVLEGSSATNLINDSKTKFLIPEDGLRGGYETTFGDYYQNFRIDTSQNLNGTFIVSPKEGRIHFDSRVGSKIIVLEYISDGLESLLEGDIKVSKYAEYALYAWVNWNLTIVKNAVPEYVIARTKKDYWSAFRNAKIKMMDIRIAEINQLLKKRNTWIK
ncbi:MAG TPA: hypothetical protein VIV55_10025 [Flavobacterium sp.]